MSADTAHTIPVDKVDYLDEDPAIRGQNYVCLSFLSPEDVIVKRDAFYFQRFTAAVGEDVGNLLGNIATKFADDVATQETVRMLRERHKYLFDPEAMDSEFKFFMEKKAAELDDDFNRSVGFRTSIRGIKVRGVYETLGEATNRVDAIKRFDTKHHVYVATVGCWCPWSPDPEDIQDRKFAETQLNTLMAGYKDNLARRDAYYNDRKNDLLQSMANQPRTHSESVVAPAAPGVHIESVQAIRIVEDDDGDDAAPGTLRIVEETDEDGAATTVDADAVGVVQEEQIQISHTKMETRCNGV